MQPASSFVPTNRRHPASLPSDGSQHCAATTAPDTVVVAGSSTHVDAGKSPRPPSSTCLGDHAVGALLGNTLGDALGPLLGDRVGVELGERLGAIVGDALGDALGDNVHDRLVHTGDSL